MALIAPFYSVLNINSPTQTFHLEPKRKIAKPGTYLILKYFTIVFGVAYTPPFGLSIKYPSPNSDEVDSFLDSNYLTHRALIWLSR